MHWKYCSLALSNWYVYKKITENAYVIFSENLCKRFMKMETSGMESYLQVLILSTSLTHWGRVTHICVSIKHTNIGWDNGLSPGRCPAIILTNAGILLIGPLGTNFSEMLIEIYTFSFKKMHLKMSSGNWWPFCLGLNELMMTQHCR